jgi:hypothetical protein
MATLWSYGALQKRKQLRSNGNLRGIEIEDGSRSTEETVQGCRHSAFIPSADARHLFLFEWDNNKNIKYIIEI